MATPEDLEITNRIRGYIQKEIEARNISQNEMARRLHLESATLSRYMTSNRLPSIGLVLRVRRYLHIDATLLLDEDPALKARKHTG